jgi:2-polyprenyl-6-hydroxyphenyl methylase/3-demethylubiquinone-9 3-methyltransferase
MRMRGNVRCLSSSVISSEVAQFDRIMGDWWDPQGPAKALHTMNPVRALFVRRAVCGALGLPAENPLPLQGLSVLDMGCGGNAMLVLSALGVVVLAHYLQVVCFPSLWLVLVVK